MPSAADNVIEKDGRYFKKEKAFISFYVLLMVLRFMCWQRFLIYIEMIIVSIIPESGKRGFTFVHSSVHIRIMNIINIWE